MGRGRRRLANRPLHDHRGSEVENGWGWLGECGVGAAFSSLLEVIRCSDSLIGYYRIYILYFFPLSFFFLYLFQRSTVESLKKFRVPTRLLRQIKHMSSNLRDEQRSRIIWVDPDPGTWLAVPCNENDVVGSARPSDSGCSTIPLTMSEPIPAVGFDKRESLGSEVVCRTQNSDGTITQPFTCKSRVLWNYDSGTQRCLTERSPRNFSRS